MTVSDEAPPLLSVRGLTKSYEDRKVLAGVDLDIHPGEIVGLVGENGAGKTTLSSIVAGLVTKSGGEMQVKGRSYAPASRQEARAAGIGIVQQELDDPGERTVLDCLLPDDDPGFDRTVRGRSLLTEAGLAIGLDERLADLDRAERTFVELLHLRADDSLTVFVMDEVSASLNARELEDLRFVARKLAASGRGVLAVSHRLSELADLCDRVAVLRGGVISDVVAGAQRSAEELARVAYGPTPEAPAEPRERTSNAADEVVLDIAHLKVGVVDDFAMKLHAGEVVGLVGGRRSGVSEVLGAVMGDRKARARRFEVAGSPTPLGSPPAAIAAGIAALREWGADEEEQTLARSLMVGGSGKELDQDEILAEVDELAGALSALRKLEDRARQIVPTYESGGQRRLRMVEQTLGLPAVVTVMFDPQLALDARGLAELDRLIAAATQRGMGLLITCSDHECLLRWCDRVLVFEDGQVRADWPTESITAESLDEIVRSGFFGRSGAV